MFDVKQFKIIYVQTAYIYIYIYIQRPICSNLSKALRPTPVKVLIPAVFPGSAPNARTPIGIHARSPLEIVQMKNMILLRAVM